jgi:hypothetical protein
MEKEATKSSQKGKKLVILGFVSIALLFLLYARYQDPILFTPDAIEPIQRIAYAFYIILLMSFGAIAFGLYQYHKYKIEKKQTDTLSIIAITTWNKKSRNIFLTIFVCYGIFFSLVSGTLVYQPEVSFSYHYGAEIPSAFVVPCCDQPGYMPEILVYLTDHVGLQIIPINLVLQVIVSYLVALNVAIAVNAFSISKKTRGASTIGAATGLFIACPTCAGSFLSLFVGAASGIVLTLALVQLQTLFIAISIPILFITPIIMAKKLRNSDGSCAIELMK